MKNLNVTALIIMLVGGVLCYGAKPISSLFKFNKDETKVLYLKIVGLLIAIVGFLMVMDII